MFFEADSGDELLRALGGVVELWGGDGRFAGELLVRRTHLEQLAGLGRCVVLALEQPAGHDGSCDGVGTQLAGLGGCAAALSSSWLLF